MMAEPTILFVAPLVLQKITRDYLNQIVQDYKAHQLPVPAEPDLLGDHPTRPEFHRQLYREFGTILGNRLSRIVVGGGAVPERDQKFITQCLNVRLIIGYGTTESGNIQVGTRIVSQIDHVVLDIPELGFSSQDKPYPRGELCVRTPNMFGGYWKDPVKTNEAFVEVNGKKWFRTGDIVEIMETEIKITGRRKETVK